MNDNLKLKIITKAFGVGNLIIFNMGTEEFFEEELKKMKKGEHYVLRLFVAGISPKSQKAIDNIKRLVSEYLIECDLEIIDIYQHPIIAKDGQIIAAPTLVKELPLPVRKFIGDLSDKNKLVVGLDLKTDLHNNEEPDENNKT